MKSNDLSKIMGVTAMTAGFCLVQGCSTIHGGGEAEDMRLRPLPSSMEPATVEVVQPTSRTIAVPVYTQEEPIHSVATTRPQLTTSYTVKKGDTLSTIAYRYQLRWQDVAAVNPGIDPKKLFVDDVIQLPGKVDVANPARRVTASASTTVKASAGSYTVKGGDTLSVIAYRHGIKTAALKQANNLTSDKILVGQKLVIPGGKSAPVKNESKVTTAPTPAAPPSFPVVATPPAPPAPSLEPLELTPPAPPAVVPDAMAAPDATLEAPPAPALPAPTAAADATAAYQNHTVAPGEDLYSVAIRWGVGTADIKAANSLTGSELVPGTVLKIPPAPAP